jgi:hypothetical protein
VIAAVHLDSPNNKAYLVADAWYNPSTFITLWTLDDPLGNPTLTAVNIPTTAAPRPNNANQLGGGSPRLEVFDRIYRNAVYKNGQLWTSTNIGGGIGNAYTFARYVRLDVVNQTLLEDAALGANGFYYLYPAAMVDEDNNLVMVFSRSADTEYVGAAFTGRREGDPPGLAPSVMLKEGEGNYVVTFGSGRNRWGDYMGIALDPKFPNVIWGFVEYAAATNTWGNWVGSFAYRYYAVEGEVTDVTTLNPIEFARVSIAETGNLVVTDLSGTYVMGLPFQNVTLNVEAFAYRDTSFSLSLTENDTVTVDVALEPEMETLISGQVRDATTGTGIEADLEFYAAGNPYPGPYKTTTTDENGNYSLTTIIGTYTIRVLNPRSPFPTVSRLTGIVLEPSGLTFNIELDPADVLLVDDDNGGSYEEYYTRAFENIQRNYHLWNVQGEGVPTAADMNEYPTKKVVWYTGDGSDSTLTEAEQAELLAHLSNGGKLFLTGQNIAEHISGSPLLEKLGVAFAQNTSQSLVRGIDNDIAHGITLLTNGSGGANNQTSRDQLSIGNSNTTRTILYYLPNQANIAGAASQDFSSTTVFLGFGWEAINGAALRQDLLNNILQYLDSVVVAIDVPLANGGVARDFELQQNYPNPFNPSTAIQFTIPQKSPVRLTVYNALGQKIKTLADRDFAAGIHEVTWDGRDDFGHPVTSGIYYYRIEAGNEFAVTKKLILLK